MGIEHSVVRERRSRSKNEENDVLIIQRSDLDLPEAYRAVELSDQVLRRINGAKDEKFEDFKQKFAKLEEENSELLQKLKEKEENKQKYVDSSIKIPSILNKENEVSLSTEEIIDKNQKKFDEMATRVEKVFFSKQYTNACSDIEKSITDCLAINPQRVLLCQHFLDIYKDCIAQHKSKLIQDQFPQEK
uniref:MICOS complex subunit MIC19 n=1 Tax=Meloidogyne incognita TaxID=6306 RepID=A0A914MWJ5_MELIC